MRKIKPKQYENAIASPSKKGRSEKIYPNIRFDLEHVPEAKDMDVGDKYHLHVHGKMTGKSESRFQKNAEFEVHHIELCDEKDCPSGVKGGKEGDEHEEHEEEREPRGVDSD